MSRLTKTYYETSKAELMQNDIQTLIEPVIPLFARIDGASPETMVIAYHALGTQLMQASANSPTPAMLKNITDALKEVAPAHHTMSINNLRAIYRFAKEYKAEDLVQKKLASIPWSYHTVLLHTVQDSQARLFYCDAILKYHWSRAALIRNIHSNLYERHARVVTNFSSTLPRSYAQQAHMVFKQMYIFALNDEVNTEREIEDGLMTYITDFLKELGPGFAFIGRQYHIQTIGDDCYIDLLLYHTLLRCYVVIELKNGPLKPEYAGKMHFYMQAVDAALKTAHDNQTIGLILCRSTSPATIATLYDTAKPMVVAEYQLKLRTEKMEKKNVQVPVQSRWYQFLRKLMNYFFILLCIVSVEITRTGENLALVCKRECGEFSYKAIIEPYWPSRIAARKDDVVPHRLYDGFLFGLYPLIQAKVPQAQKITELGRVASLTVALLKHAVVAQLKERDFIDYLLAEPVMAFNILSCINSLCWGEISTASDVITAAIKAGEYAYDSQNEVTFLKHYFNKYEKLCPVFWCGCPYSMRPFPPLSRRPLCDTFHEKIISAVLDKIGTTNNAIHYVTDPMEGLFTDLFIVSRVLAQKPNASIAVHVLNGKYKEYCIFKDALQLTRALDTHDTIDWSAHLTQIDSYYQEHKEISYRRPAAVIGALFEETEIFVKPTLTFLRKSFPQAQVELYLHSDQVDYWDYRKEHKLPVADIIYTTHEKFINRLEGLPDSPGHWTRPNFQHEHLCIKTLQENPSAGCFFVSHNDLNSNATYACTVHLKRHNSQTRLLWIPAQPDSVIETTYLTPKDTPYPWINLHGKKVNKLFVDVERI